MSVMEWRAAKGGLKTPSLLCCSMEDRRDNMDGDDEGGAFSSNIAKASGGQSNNSG